MLTTMSMMGVGLIFALLMLLVPLALLVVLQVWLCKKGRWLGLILPALCLMLSLVMVFSFSAFQMVSGSSLTITTEGGEIIQQEITEQRQSLTPQALATISVAFLVTNIPTLAFGGIWLHYKNRQDFRDDLNKMKIEDLE